MPIAPSAAIAVVCAGSPALLAIFDSVVSAFALCVAPSADSAALRTIGRSSLVVAITTSIACSVPIWPNAPSTASGTPLRGSVRSAWQIVDRVVVADRAELLAQELDVFDRARRQDPVDEVVLRHADRLGRDVDRPAQRERHRPGPLPGDRGGGLVARSVMRADHAVTGDRSEQGTRQFPAGQCGHARLLDISVSNERRRVTIHSKLAGNIEQGSGVG